MDNQNTTKDESEDLPVKLTEAQKRVMRLMSKGWEATNLLAQGVEINGQHICGRNTMIALEKIGLVQIASKYRWKATADGLAWRDQ